MPNVVEVQVNGLPISVYNSGRLHHVRNINSTSQVQNVLVKFEDVVSNPVFSLVPKAVTVVKGSAPSSVAANVVAFPVVGSEGKQWELRFSGAGVNSFGCLNAGVFELIFNGNQIAIIPSLFGSRLEYDDQGSPSLRVDSMQVQFFTLAFGATVGSPFWPGYTFSFDRNGDGFIDPADIELPETHWTWTV